MSSRVQIAFDLNVKRLKEIYTKSTGKSYTNAYNEIKKFMTARGYEHRQGSVYHSTTQKTRIEVTNDVKLLMDHFGWFSQCVEKMDYANLQQRHDLMCEIKSEITLAESSEMTIDRSLKKGEEALQKMFKKYNEMHQHEKDRSSWPLER